MPGDYIVSLKITVNKGETQINIVVEETIFRDMSFAEMTRISSEFYELIGKLRKEKK